MTPQGRPPPCREPNIALEFCFDLPLETSALPPFGFSGNSHVTRASLAGALPRKAIVELKLELTTLILPQLVSDTLSTMSDDPTADFLAREKAILGAFRV